MTSKLDKAIEAVLAASQPQGCWASHLSGDAKKFVTRLTEEESKGVKIARRMVSRILNETWDIKVSPDAIANHLSGGCLCDRKAAS